MKEKSDETFNIGISLRLRLITLITVSMLISIPVTNFINHQVEQYTLGIWGTILGFGANMIC